MNPQTVLPLPAEPATAVSAPPRLPPTIAPAQPPPSGPQLRSAPGARKAAWLALHFVDWPLLAVLSGMTLEQRLALESRPFAIIDDDRKRRVLVCNQPARTSGLCPGHSLNAAIALCSRLEVAARDPTREAALLEAAARSCQRYTSTVSIEPPNELLLEVRGSFRLFGGVEALLAAVLDEFAARGMVAAAALTPTARSALWLSRGTSSVQPVRIVQPRALPATLLRLPIGVLQWPPEVTLRLARFGVSTLADLRRLPRGGLGRRIGAAHLAELDAAFGRQPEIRGVLAELPRYADRVVLDAEIETTGLLEPLITARLFSLERFLIARTLALGALTLELVHRSLPLTRMEIGLAVPTMDTSHLQTLIHERLAGLQLPAPVLELRMHAARLVPATSHSRHLFQSGQKAAEDLPQRLSRLVETLESRLGKQALHALRLVAEHRPERAQSQSPLLLAAAGEAAIRSKIPQELPQRPLWLLSEPRALRMAGFTFVSGPERIESGWWDAQPCRRDYFIVRGRHGSLCWVFRDLAGQGQWYLHGLFS